MWAAYIAYEIYILRRMNQPLPIVPLLAFYTLNILLFYFHAKIAGPFAYRHSQRVIWLILISLAEAAVYNILSVVLDILLTSLNAGELTIDIVPYDFLRSSWRGGYFIFLSTGYFFVLRYIESAHSEARLKGETLRAQINPHLLHNMLGYIYSSVQASAPRTAEAVALLSDSMRYAMAPAEQDGLVSVAKEIEHIERYVEMYRIKFNDRLMVSMRFDEACYRLSLRLPPLILMTFVENMFKHGNLQDAVGIIEAKVVQGCLCFHTENKSKIQRAKFSDGIGLKNAHERLQQYYTSKFSLAAFENEGNFIVNLKIKV